MSNLQTYYFKLDFQKVDQHTGGKWLIHGPKRRKDNLSWILARFMWYSYCYPSGLQLKYEVRAESLGNGSPCSKYT